MPKKRKNTLLNMEVQITLPESIADIKLWQYLKMQYYLSQKDLDEKQFNDSLIKLFADIDLDKINHSDYEMILAQIKSALDQESTFKNRFEIDGQEFGFILNFDEITQGEFIDMSEYSKDEDDLPKLMAVCYRPITNKDKFGNYEIEPYEGTSKYAEIMMQAPMNIVNGVLGFFLNLSKELRKHTQKSMQVEAVKE